MSTAMAMTMESCTEAPATSQPIAVSAAVACTTGAYSRETRSASRNVCDFVVLAFSRSRSTSSTSVPAPAAVIRMVSAPEALMLPA